MKLKREYKIYKNINQGIIIISDDKARLKLIEYQNALISRHNWIAPLTTSISILATIIAVDKFQNAFFFSATVWEAIFNIGLFLSLIWFVMTLIQMYKNRNKGGINELIDQLKGECLDLGNKERRGAIEKFLEFKKRILKDKNK
ncbi:MAG: hypothetical protein ACKKMP_02965 [Candidatus Nealsonbacteria bacterium]